MDNKEKILVSALDLFYTKGYDGVGVQEIADTANVTKPTLYHYFGSKYGVLEGVLENHSQVFETALLNLTYDDNDLPMTLYRFVKTFFQLIQNNWKYYGLYMSMLYAPKESDMHKAVMPYATQLVQGMTDTFLKAGHVIGNMNGRQQQYAITFLGMINQYILLCENREEMDLLNEEKAFGLVHQFLHGIYV